MIAILLAYGFLALFIFSAFFMLADVALDGRLSNFLNKFTEGK